MSDVWCILRPRSESEWVSQNPLDLEVLPFSFLLGRRSLLSSFVLLLSILLIPDAFIYCFLIIIAYWVLGGNDRFVHALWIYLGGNDRFVLMHFIDLGGIDRFVHLYHIALPLFLMQCRLSYRAFMSAKVIHGLQPWSFIDWWRGDPRSSDRAIPNSMAAWEYLWFVFVL